MKTRTLLLLSVATGLMILLAGGVLLLQLSDQEGVAETTPIGVEARVGDARVTVIDSSVDSATLTVALDVAGVDDPDARDNFRLVTGDRQLAPLETTGGDACVEIRLESQRCSLSFDVSAVDGSSRVLIMRRGDSQATWRLE